MGIIKQSPYQTGRNALFDWLGDHSLIPRLPDNPFDEGSDEYDSWEKGFIDASKSVRDGNSGGVLFSEFQLNSVAQAPDRFQHALLKG